MFPFSIRGSINFETNKTYSPELEKTTLTRIHDRLLKEKPKWVEITQNELQFKRGFPHIFSFNKLLEMIDGGILSIEPDGMGLSVNYQLRFTSLIVFFTLACSLIEYMAFPRGGWMFS